jgi:predicted nucleotidyltransferase
MNLQQALFTRTRGAVLTLYFLNPKQRFHIREVVRQIGSGHSTVQYELQRLWKAGLLTRHRHGNRIEYQANPESFVFHELAALLERTAGPVGKLYKALRSLRSDIDVAFIYGSVASDTATAESDVDVMVIGRASFAQVVRAITPVQDALGLEVNPSVYPREEFVAKLKTKDPFLQNILAGAKKFVIGDARELAGLV